MANSLMGGIDEVFLRTDSSGARSFLTDALGSTIALTDSSAAFQTTYSFGAFGSTSLTGSTSTNSFAYTGRELDTTGLYFYRARYYNPAFQRFISEDPIRLDSGGPNFYAYAENSPTNYVDPQGRNIGVVGNLQDIQNYITAINYLKADPGMAQIIQQMQTSSIDYQLIPINDGNDAYDPSTHTIYWDPHSACTVTSGGNQSPALGLGHEMAHGTGGIWGRILSIIPAGRYTNLEERRVINGPEHNAANSLGEPVRHDHYCTDTPVVPTPTSR